MEKLDKKIELPKKGEITQENGKEVAMPTKQECSGLWRAKSVVHQLKGELGLYNNVKVNWFVQGRKTPVGSYELACTGHPPEIVGSVYEFLQECFTEKEVEMLQKYLHKALNLPCEIRPVELPIPKDHQNLQVLDAYKCSIPFAVTADCNPLYECYFDLKKISTYPPPWSTFTVQGYTYLATAKEMWAMSANSRNIYIVQNAHPYNIHCGLCKKDTEVLAPFSIAIINVSMWQLEYKMLCMTCAKTEAPELYMMLKQYYNSGRGDIYFHYTEDRFGNCPICKQTYGALYDGQNYWFVCKKHKTKWLANQTDCFFNKEVERISSDELASYKEVKPVLLSS